MKPDDDATAPRLHQPGRSFSTRRPEAPPPGVPASVPKPMRCPSCETTYAAYTGNYCPDCLEDRDEKVMLVPVGATL